MRTFLIRGMVAGLCAAFIAFGFATLTGESAVDRAIAFEEHTAQLDAAKIPTGGPATPEPEMVSRTVQSSVGLLTGLVATGVAFGGIFSIGFAFANGRMGRLGARTTALIVASLAFVAVYLVPFLKYPANPPAIGHADTIGYRTELYFLMITASVLAMALAANLTMRLVSRLGGWNAALVGVGSYLAVMLLTMIVLPVVDEVPDGFPASTLWQFRASSIGVQAALWIGIGLVFGALSVRSARARSRPRADRFPSPPDATTAALSDAGYGRG